MSGNKVNTKAKGKDDKSKGGNKSNVPNNEEIEDTDLSLLRKPIQTSITGFSQARKIFDMATEELKSLLSDECDLLYECKVCRNLFRSLANFISHKRVYCKDKFSSTVHGHFIKTSTLNEMIKIKNTEEGYQESLKEINKSEDMDEVDERIPLTKDLTSIIEMIANNKGQCEYGEEETQFTFQKIPNTAVAMFQNVDTGDDKESENMKSQVNELDNILSRNIAVLQNDGNFVTQSSAPDESTEGHTDGVIQISDDEEGNTFDLKCKKCGMQFSTQKTLRFHMKYKHVGTRVVYPCPDCLEIFSTSWSVYRHLFKVHRKTAAQVRRLRESIQAKAFKMNNPPAFYEKRKNNMKTVPAPKITEEERLDQENQAWMDNMECDGEIPRCGGCGRTFERRAALAAHTHTCQPRSRALARRPQETKRIEIQIRKDYNKGPTPSIVLPMKITDVNENKMKELKESKVIKEQKEMNEQREREERENKEPKDEEVEEGHKVKSTRASEDEEVPKTGSKVESAIAAEDITTDSIMQHSEDESSKSNESPEKAEDAAPNQPLQVVKPIRLPFAQHSEKSNLMALRQRVIPDIELETLRCKKCDVRSTHIQELYDHVAKHYNWMRYACKLCNFKHYHFDKLPEHVKIVHKLKGDKDFYFSTVKAIDGAEASELAGPVDEPPEADDNSPNSRRPSRCSSDSSRLSDDSSSSSTKVEGSRKRKQLQKVPTRGISKRSKSMKGNKDDEWENKADSPSNKTFEENSSDIDDAYEKVGKKRIEEIPSVASRRPVRRKTKPKNEDFEYDLSNLLKMEAQGYRDSQTVTTTTKSSQTKKKTQQESLSNYEMLNKECCGALVSMSRKSVENAKAHMKTSATLYIKKDKIVPSSIFVRPMIPRGLNRGEKLSPRKDAVEERKGNTSPNKETKDNDDTTINLDKDNTEITTNNISNDASTSKEQNDSTDSSNAKHLENNKEPSFVTAANTTPAEINQNISNITSEKMKTKNINIPSVVPIKFRRQSLDVIKNPIINKNISEFTKAGMKTKILVIKPINRKKDGLQSVNTQLKYQTITLKESSKSSTNEDKVSDQVVVVKVPKVDCISRSLPDSSISKSPCEKVSVIKRVETGLSANDETALGNIEIISNIKPPKNNEHTNSDKNGDVTCTKPKHSEIESTKLVEEINHETKLCDIDSPSKVDCDNSTKKVVDDITSDEGPAVCITETLKVDDPSEMECD